LTLSSGPTPWGAPKPRDERNVPANLAGLLIVEAFGTLDPFSIQTLPPFSAFSPVSTLIHYAMSGEHYGVRVTGEDLERLIAWVDTNGPYLGDIEIRAMYDPISPTIENIPPIRPRIATAPRINRFDLRQDGDTSEEALGPLRLMPNGMSGFDPNRALLEFRNQELIREFQDEGIKVVIIAASYGAGDRRLDVTDRITQAFNGTRFIPIGNYNDAFTDPVRNVVKNLQVIYQIDDGPIQTAHFAENATIILPR